MSRTAWKGFMLGIKSLGWSDEWWYSIHFKKFEILYLIWSDITFPFRVVNEKCGILLCTGKPHPELLNWWEKKSSYLNPNFFKYLVTLSKVSFECVLFVVQQVYTIFSNDMRNSKWNLISILWNNQFWSRRLRCTMLVWLATSNTENSFIFASPELKVIRQIDYRDAPLSVFRDFDLTFSLYFIRFFGGVEKIKYPF